MGDAFDQARQHFLDGLAHFQANALIEAELCFESALALMPGRPSTLTNLGATRVKLGKASSALPILEQATAAEPGNLQAWSYLALAHADLAQYTEALACYDRALALDDTAAALWLQQAQTLVLQMHALVISVAQLSSPPPVIAQVMADNPELQFMRIDFESFLRSTLTTLVRGTLAAPAVVK